MVATSDWTKATKTARHTEVQSSASRVLGLVEISWIWAGFALGRTVFSRSYSGLPAVVVTSTSQHIDIAERII